MLRFLGIIGIIILNCSVQANVCRMYLPSVEQNHSIPNRLLHAISIIESGVRQGKQVDSWPWIINANGKPYIFKSKLEAITKVRELQGKGIRSIDVGCMQINLKQHPNAFKNLEEAFDPGKNIAYAARFLSALKDKLGNWRDAVAYYHSATASRNAPYKKKVLAVWKRLLDAGGYDVPSLQSAVMKKLDPNEGDFVKTFKGEEESDVSVRVTFAPYKTVEVPKQIERPIRKEPKKIRKVSADKIPLADGFFLLNAPGKFSDTRPMVKASFKLKPLQPFNGKFYKLK